MWRLKGLLPKESGGLEGRLIDVGNMKVQVQKTIAQGGFSVVYKCLAGGRVFALKHLIIRDKETYDLVQKEIQIMLQLRGHPNVVALHAHSYQDTPATGGKECFLLLDYCDNMLVHVMDNLAVKGQFFNEQQVLTIFRDVCNAVYAMHCQIPPIAHRDLKAENVLMAGEGSWKLCDFGSCSTNHKRFETEREMGQEEDNIRKHTTPAYRAPEMWDLYRRELISEKVDIWALGCLLYRMAFFKSAFDGESKLQILNGNYRIPDAPKYSPALTNLIKDMLSAEPEKRPDIGRVWRAVNEMLPQNARKPAPEKAPMAAKSGGPSPRSPEQAAKPARAAPSPPARPPPSGPSGSAASGGAFWAKFGDAVTATAGPSAAGQTLGGSPPDSPRKPSTNVEETLGQLRPPSPQPEAQPKESASLKSTFLKKTGAAADMLKTVKGTLASKIASATGHERSGFADSSEIGFMKAGPDGRLDEEAEPVLEPVREKPTHSRGRSAERAPSPRLPSPGAVAPQPPAFAAFETIEPQGFAAFSSESPAASRPLGQPGRNSGSANGSVPVPAGVPGRPRTPSEGGQAMAAELERVKDELRKVLDEKAYLAERCSKMEFIIRALQDQIKELQASSPVVGLVKDEDRQPGGRRSFASPAAATPPPPAGSFWDRADNPSSARAASLSPPPNTAEKPPSRPASTGVSPSNSSNNLPASSSWQSFDDAEDTAGKFAGSGLRSAAASPARDTLFDAPASVFDPPVATVSGAMNGKGPQSSSKQSQSRTLDPFEALSQLRV